MLMPKKSCQNIRSAFHNHDKLIKHMDEFLRDVLLSKRKSDDQDLRLDVQSHDVFILKGSGNYRNQRLAKVYDMDVING